MTNSPLLDVRESCAYCGIGLTTLYAQVIPRTGVVKIGRRTFLRRARLDRYLAANDRPPAMPLLREKGASRTAAISEEDTSPI